MNITEAERILGLTGRKYDITGIQFAYAKASKSASTYNARKRCREARETLERYYRSLRLTHQVDGAYSAEAMAGSAKEIHDMTAGVRSKFPKPGISYDKPVAPSSDPSKASHKVWKALLMTLWDMTPWRFYLMFWSAVIGVLFLLLSLAFPVMSPVTDIIGNVCQIAFFVGLIDAFWLHKGTEIGGRLSKRIDAID